MPTILARVVAVVEDWSKLPNDDTTESLQNIWARSKFQFTVPFHPQAVDDLTDRLQTEFRRADPDTRDLRQLTSAAFAPVGAIESTDDLNDEVFRSPTAAPPLNIVPMAGKLKSQPRGKAKSKKTRAKSKPH